MLLTPDPASGLCKPLGIPGSTQLARRGLLSWPNRSFEYGKTCETRKRGAKQLYISATPSEHTVDFYLRLGCRLDLEPDSELFELEPEDIHLECELE